MKRSFLAALLLSAFAFPSSSFGVESPLYIPFQGQVTNQAGGLSADGQYSVIFNLYDQAVGGQPVWSERHVKIGVTKGMINVFMGSIAPLTSVDFSQTKYLGITVDTDNLATTADPEMVPRSLIMPAFHAKKAENSTKLAGQDWSVFFVNGSGVATNDPTTGFLSGAKIRPASITATQLGTDAVDSGQIKNNALTTSKIADGEVKTSDLADLSVTTDKLADLAVTNDKVAENGIGPDKIAIPAQGQFLVPGGGLALSQNTAQTAYGVPGLIALDALKISIFATGRPLIIGLCPSPPNPEDNREDIVVVTSGGGSLIYYRQELDAQNQAPIGPEIYLGRNDLVAGAVPVYYPSGSFRVFDTTAVKGRLYNYYIKLRLGSGTMEIAEPRMFAHDLQ